MTKSESFISRWSRLKRESDERLKAEATVGAPPFEAATTATGEEDVARAWLDAPTARDFDPASLPPIDSINVGTDIRSFLQSGVPAELTRAALRRAWVSDPTIRDFIGIAENQWDFTDPTAIPGFGPLRETGDAPSLVDQALGRLEKASEAFVDMCVSGKEAPSATTDARHGAIENRVQEPRGIPSGQTD